MRTLLGIVRLLVIAILLVVVPQAATAQQAELLLFGGDDHDVFLGCLTCSKYNSSSVWNAYGPYGSEYSAGSIWNAYGAYGSQYRQGSPWNAYSSAAPVVVDREGRFYGYFSANTYHAKRTTVAALVWILDNHEWIFEHLGEVREQMP
jgi:hypothetical protein